VLVGQGPSGSVLLGSGRHKFVAAASIVEAVANLALSVALVPKYGILGVALGTAIPVWIVNLGFIVPAGCRTAGLRVTMFAREVLLPCLLAAMPAAMLCVWLRATAAPRTLSAVIAEGAAVGLLYVVAFMLALGPAVRAHYTAHLRAASRALLA
jgi:O-antigen/teichoic acid export membrane protein